VSLVVLNSQWQIACNVYRGRLWCSRKLARDSNTVLISGLRSWRIPWCKHQAGKTSQVNSPLRNTKKFKNLSEELLWCKERGPNVLWRGFEQWPGSALIIENTTPLVRRATCTIESSLRTQSHSSRLEIKYNGSRRAWLVLLVLVHLTQKHFQRHQSERPHL